MATESQIDPRLLEEAEHDPVLKYMLEHGIPLTREKYISLNYIGHPPEPWTEEDERQLPSIFQLESAHGR